MEARGPVLVAAGKFLGKFFHWMKHPCYYSQPPRSLRNSAVTRRDARACWAGLCNTKHGPSLQGIGNSAGSQGRVCYNCLPAIAYLRAFSVQKLATSVRALATAAALVVCVPKILAG